jgi:hypothetical protein
VDYIKHKGERTRPVKTLGENKSKYLTPEVVQKQILWRQIPNLIGLCLMQKEINVCDARFAQMSK